LADRSDASPIFKLLGVISEEFHILQEARLDVVVEKELTEYSKSPGKELVRVVYSRVHDARPVRSDRVCNLLNPNAVHILILPWPLTEYLRVEVIREAGDKHVDVPHYLENVKPLLQCPNRQVGLCELQPITCLV